MPESHSLGERIQHGDLDTIDTKARYLAYASRLKTALSASSRYLAYTSDVGEAFRPIVSPWVVRAAYGISWAYLGLDVSYEGYKAVKAGQVKGKKELEKKRVLSPCEKDNSVVAAMVVKRSVFQSLASMALPMVTIHSIVKYSAKGIFQNVKNARVKAWGPTFMGLGIVPFLPYLFDHPVEQAVDKAFEPIEKYVLEKAVPHVAHQTVENERKTQ